MPIDLLIGNILNYFITLFFENNLVLLMRRSMHLEKDDVKFRR